MELLPKMMDKKVTECLVPLRRSNPLEMDMVEGKDGTPANGKVEQPTDPGVQMDNEKTTGTHKGDKEVEQSAPPRPQENDW